MIPLSQFICNCLYELHVKFKPALNSAMHMKYIAHLPYIQHFVPIIVIIVFRVYYRLKLYSA